MGNQERGQTKKYIIAWEEITKPKLEGGLDIKPFDKQLQAL